MLFFTTACYSDCGKSKVMAKGVKIPFDVPVEVTEPNLSSLIYNLPLNHPDGVAIIQGPLNLNAGCSHGYLNCLYALDFATCTPPGKILAARSGVVVALHDEGHLHYFTFRSLSLMLIERCGFSRVEKLGYFVGPNGQRIVGHKLADRLARFWPELFSEIVLVAYV